MFGKKKRTPFSERRSIFIDHVISEVTTRSRPEECNIEVMHYYLVDPKTNRPNPNQLVIEMSPNIEDREEIAQAEAVKLYKEKQMVSDM